jgi:FkbM family methyltransferase
MKQETPAPEANVSNIVALKKPVLISDKLREMNAQLHNDNALYGAGGHRHAELVKKLVSDTKAESVLDYGCGKGTLAENLPFPIWQYDPAIPGRDEMPRSADLVLCLDVLEHIEPDLLGNVLGHLAKLVKKVGYFVISTRPAKKTYADGRNAHLIVKSGEWWEKTLSKFFSLGSITEKDKELHVVVGPKGAKNASLSNTNVRHDGTDATFYTPNETTRWRANTLFTKEPCTIEWIDTFKKGEVFYDIGANVGGYSIWAAKRRGVKVYAFEPEASNYAVLCRNMTLNEVDGAAYCAALSDLTRLSSIYLSTQEAGGSCNSFDSQVGFDLKPRQGIKQGAIGFSLDDVCGYDEQDIGTLPNPAHIKIDVDGMEHLVVNGARWLLRSGSVKSLLIECNPNLPEHVKMMASLESLGFQYDRQQFEAAQRKEGAFKGCGECIFTRSNPVRDRLIEKIRAAEIREYPFEHIYIEDVFDPLTFNKICEAAKGVPDNEGGKGSCIAFELDSEVKFQPLEEARGTKGYPQRYVADAPDLVGWMTDGALRKALDEKFRVLSGNDEICLLRDKPGYAIGPHTDTPAKAVTALFYLTQNWTEAEHGTTVYKPKRPYTDPEGRHGKFEDFEEVWTAPGKPNSVFIFKRTDISFHGCKPYEGTGQRDILLWDSKQYLDKKP